jgi:hypothetical protein
MPQRRNALIKRASLHPLTFDDVPNVNIVQRTPARGRTSYRAYSTRSYSQDSFSSGRNFDSYEGIFYFGFNWFDLIKLF